MFERIIVAIDGSEPAQHALSVACDLTQKYSSEIYLIHSPQLETTAIAVGSGAIEILPDASKIEAAGRKVIEEAEKAVLSKGCEIKKSIIGNRDPATDILQTVEEVNADLVVMGRRGLGGVSSLLLGSVSQKVSHKTTCTCMTVS